MGFCGQKAAALDVLKNQSRVKCDDFVKALDLLNDELLDSSQLEQRICIKKSLKDAADGIDTTIVKFCEKLNDKQHIGGLPNKNKAKHLT